jgi:hypothetical protein
MPGQAVEYFILTGQKIIETEKVLYVAETANKECQEF